MSSKLVKLAAAAAMTIGLAVGSSNAYAADKDIVDTAVAAGQFNTLATALTAAGLVDTLKGPGPFTVFAPTDAASPSCRPAPWTACSSRKISQS